MIDQNPVLELLHSSKLFSVLPEEELQRIAPNLRSETYERGELIIRENERGDTAYLISKGEAAVVTEDFIGEVVTLRVFDRGEIFGEVALVEDTPRTATVRAASDLEVYVIDRFTFGQLQANNPRFAQAVRERVDFLGVHRFLKKASPFARVPDNVIRRVATQLVPVPVKAGQAVVTEGEEGDKFYVIRAGNYAVAEKGRQVATLGAGDVFGEIALLTGGPRIATVTALVDGEVLSLSKADFDAVLKENTGFGRQLAELGRIRFRATTGQNLYLPDPLTTMMPYLQPKGRNRYWLALGASIAAFAASAYGAFVLQIDWAMLTTLVAGSFIAPIMYAIYMKQSDILETRPGALVLVFALAAVASIPISAGLQLLFRLDWYSLQGAFLIALVEVPVAVLLVLWFLRRSTNRFRMDGLVFGAAAGMGFAAFETLLFGIGYFRAPTVLVEALAVRSVLAPLAQGAWVAIVCGVIFSDEVRGSLFHKRVLGALAAAIGLRTLWDWQPLAAPIVKDGFEYYTWYGNLPWFLLIGAGTILALRLLVNRAAQEEVSSIVALNPELAAQQGGRTTSRGIRCHRCEQMAPAGAHYCVRCGAVLRSDRRPAPVVVGSGAAAD